MNQEYITKGILKPVQRVKVKKHIPTWVNSFSRVTGLVIALCAMVMLSACSDSQAMETCQQTHSFETCFLILN